MTAIWIAIGVAAAVNFAFKAAGPVALAGRTLPRRFERLLAVLPAALLTALVITQTFAREEALVLDARAAGLAAAGVALALRADMLVVLLAATATTAGLRAL